MVWITQSTFLQNSGCLDTNVNYSAYPLGATKTESWGNIKSRGCPLSFPRNVQYSLVFEWSHFFRQFTPTKFTYGCSSNFHAGNNLTSFSQGFPIDHLFRGVLLIILDIIIIIPFFASIRFIRKLLNLVDIELG